MFETKIRKLDHIRIVLDSHVEAGNTLLNDVYLVHNPLPEIDFNEVDTSVRFCGKTLEAPLMIVGMTGGHEVSEKINCMLAQAAAEHGIAMGVGSQRAALEDPSLARTYSVARKCGGQDLVLVANIGGAQLLEKGPAIGEQVVEMIEADALAVHLNVGQEMFQPEGDHQFKGLLKVIGQLVERLSVPVIVKETGQGLSYDVVYALRGAGVRFFDVAGSGGTSWILVEAYRHTGSLSTAARWFGAWGNPTALAIIEARWAAPDACIVASGGIRTGLDAVKALALGADIAGFGLPALEKLAEAGLEDLKNYIAAMKFSVKAGLALTGARRIEELWEKPVMVLGRLRELASLKGIKLEDYQSIRGFMHNRCA